MDDDKILSNEELSKLEEMGITSRGVGFVKDNKFMKGSDVDAIVAEMREEKSREEELQAIKSLLGNMQKKISYLTLIPRRLRALRAEVEELKKSSETGAVQESTASITAVAEEINNNILATNNSINSLISIFNEQIDKKKQDQYTAEESAGEASKPVGKPSVSSMKAEDKGSAFDSLKSLLLNPVVITAFSGLVYMFLPKDVKEKINAFFKGLWVSFKEFIGENDKLKLSLIAIGGALATYFGSKALEKLGSALIDVLTLINKAKKALGGLGKKAGRRTLAVAGIAAAGAIAAAKIMSEKDEVPKEEGGGVDGAEPEALPQPTPETKPAAVPAPAAPPAPAKPAQVAAPTPSMSSVGTGLKPGGQMGLKPGGKIGLQAPAAGDDKSTMAMIKMHEGVRYTPYKDSLGLWTVGVGHLIRDGKTLPPEYNRKFSPEEVDALFAKDYKHHKEAAAKIPGFNNLGPSGQAALTDLTFNMGPAWYKKWPNFVKQLKEGDAEGAASNLENSKWFGQVGRRGPTIVSMIRNGFNKGTSGQETPVGSQDKSIDLSESKRENTSPSSGAAMMASSESVDTKSMGGGGSTTNNIDNSRTVGDKVTASPPPPIPSPIADRTGLSSGTYHEPAPMMR